MTEFTKEWFAELKKQSCVMCQEPVSINPDQWAVEIRPSIWIHYKCLEHLYDHYLAARKESVGE